MSSTYVAVVTVHLIAAIVWLGGMLFFALAAPVLRAIDDERARAAVFDRLGRRFRIVGWICIGVLLVSGVVQLRMRGWWGLAVWTSPVFLTSRAAVTLAWKLGAVALMVAIQGAHDFWLGPRAGAAEPGTPEARSLRRRAAWLARVNAMLALVLVYFAVRLARGG